MHPDRPGNLPGDSVHRQRNPRHDQDHRRKRRDKGTVMAQRRPDHAADGHGDGKALRKAQAPQDQTLTEIEVDIAAERAGRGEQQGRSCPPDKGDRCEKQPSVVLQY